MEKEDSLFSLSLLDSRPFRAYVCDRHMTPSTPRSVPSPLPPPHPTPHYFHTTIIPVFDPPTPQLLLLMHKLFLEDSEVWEAILVPMGVRKVCSHKGFK
jgi:hypothetical protein